MPENVQPTEPTPTPAPEPTSTPAPTVELDGPFDEERAKQLIAALRADKESLKSERDGLKTERDTFATKVTEFETAQLSEQEKVTQQLQTVQAELAQTRREAALTKHGLPESALVFLTASSAEDIESQAAALAALQPAKANEPAPTPVDSRATPSLPDGQFTPTPEPFDPVALAASARARRF